MKKAADIGITNRKIIVIPCIVKIWLYCSALRSVPSGWANWVRINRASNPPTMKNTNADTPYMIPIFLWSTVVNQLQKPVNDDGRRNPRLEVPVTLTLAMVGRSLPSGQAVQVGHQRS